MALFALWRDDAIPDPAGAAARAGDAAHLAGVQPVRWTLGRWTLLAWATDSAFLPAAAQLWRRGDEACVVHGLPWRMRDGVAEVLDAAGLAALIDRPDARPDLGGEFAVARLFADGTLIAFSDPAGLHQLHRPADGRAIAAGRAGMVAALAGDARRQASLWTLAIGYRVGRATGWRGVVQEGQGARLIAPAEGPAREEAMPGPVEQGRGGDRQALLGQGIAEAQALLRLAAARADPLPLPVTGGKDSRAVLALALSAGLRDRIDLFTRGPEGHPDVAAGRLLAQAAGLPHRREDPLGSGDIDWTATRFARTMAAIAFQTDGGMGGWDRALADRIGAGVLVTGHLGEVLKAYAKRPPDDPADPIALIRGQAPFDPLGLLRPDARARLAGELAGQMSDWRDGGAADADLDDLFYWANRVPNWLGGLRGVQSFERQPVLPLGVPALQRLAFAMTADERRREWAHHAIVAACAPALLDLPFAHQRWAGGLETPPVAPLLAPEGMKLFGSWQFSINRNARIRAFLARLFETSALPLWDDVDRAALLDRLRSERFGYEGAIELLGLTVTVLHAAGLALPARIGGDWPDTPEALARLIPASPRLVGHVDAAGGGRIAGWLHAPDWPGVQPLVEARVGDRLVATAPADRPRPDLAAAGIGDGSYGFEMAADGPVVLTGLDADSGPEPLA